MLGTGRLHAFVRRHLNVSSIQARATLRAAAFFFVFVAAVTVTKSATNALFLARRNPADLPYLYLLTAAAVAMVTFALGQRLAKRSARTVLVGAQWRASLAMLALVGLAAADVYAALGFLYVGAEVYATALSVLFWARLGELFDVRTAKRVIGFIAGAGMAGAVVGGLALRGFSAVVPSLTWAAAAMVAMLASRPLLGSGPSGPIERHSIRFEDGLRYAVKDGFPRGVALLVAVLAVQTAAVDYVFRVGAAQAYAGDEAALTALFGGLHAVVGVGALVVQVFGTGPMLRRFGVFAFLTVIPVLCMVAPNSALFVLKAFEMMGSLSLHQPALAVFYNPMPIGQRDAIRAVIDGAIKKLGAAIGGVALLVFGVLFSDRLLLVLVIALGGLLIWRIYRLRPRYLAALSAKLAQEEGPAAAAIDPGDQTTRRRLLTALGAADPGIVLRALDILWRHPGPDLKEPLVGLLTHAHEAVRQRAIALIERDPHPRYRAALERIVLSVGPRPKGSAARALELIDRDAAVRVLTPMLDLPDAQHDPGLVCAAIRVGLREGGIVELRAAQVLQDLLATGTDAPVELRRALARLIGELGSGPPAARLAPLLTDPDPGVRQAAARSAAIAHHPYLPARLVPLLTDPDVRREAETALVGYGEATVSLLADVLADGGQPPALRGRVVRVLRAMGSDAAAVAMLHTPVDDEPRLRFEIAQALFRLRTERPNLAFDPDRVHHIVRRVLQDYAANAEIAEDLFAGGPEFALLARTLRARQNQNMLAVVMMLGLIFDHRAIHRAVAGIRAGLIPDALELLDVTLEGSDLRKVVLRALEDRMRTAQPAAATSWVRALARGEDRPVALLAQRSLLRLPGANISDDLIDGDDMDMPDVIIDRLFALERVQLFQGLSIEALTKVASLAKEGWAAPRETIFRQGEPGESMYVIVAGEVRLLKDGRPLIELQPGESFGQISMLDRGPRPVTAWARDEGVEYLVIDRGPFMDLLFDEPPLITGMFAVLARRLRELVDLTQPSLSGGRPLSGLASPQVPISASGRTLDR